MTALTSTNATELCTYGPPAERKRHWILKFDDADKNDMHFTDEHEAIAMFRRCSTAWTCTLFVTATFAPLIPVPGLLVVARAQGSATAAVRCGEDQLLRYLEALHTALEESVKVQSHYAGLLNDYESGEHDGGRHLQFANADAWIARLREIGTL